MDPTERWKSIAPASDEPGRQRSGPDLKKRRQAIPVECIRCRVGKAKCDGTRPQCMRCTNNDLPCQYDVAEGVSRAERMKLIKRDELSSRLEELERIINALRSGSDNEASNILARLRLGERIDDLARYLPSTSSFGSNTRKPSLGAQDLPESSRRDVSFESLQVHNKGVGTSLYGHGSSTSLTSSVEQQTNLSDPFLASRSRDSSTRGKRPTTTDSIKEGTFLSILFDREDYLLPLNEGDKDGDNEEDALDGDHAGYIDPRLLRSTSSPTVAISSSTPPIDLSGTGFPAPAKGGTNRLIHATHLRGRQAMVDGAIVHPNFRNHFGNLPFSSSIHANNFPYDVQHTQINNLFLPTWSMMTVNTRADPGSMRHAFVGILQEAVERIGSGTPADHIIEIHPNIAALYDKDEFNKSGMLSKWAASMVHSAHLKGTEFTDFASMYLFWYIMRWMIFPSPETYAVMPVWLRPTPNQLFMPHISMLDYVAWPAFRELAVQLPTMQERMGWLMNMSMTVRCNWWSATEDSLVRREETGCMDLCAAAKETMRDISNWSLGPSFRGYVSNADSYVRIRTDD